MEVQSRKSTFVTFPPENESPLGSGPSGVTFRDESPSKNPKRSSPWLRKWKYRCWDKLKSFLLATFAMANVAVSIWIVYEHGNLPEMFPGDHFTTSRSILEKKCHFPELQPFSDEIKRVMIEPARIDCKLAANTDYKGDIFFRSDREGNLIRIRDPGIPCCYRPIYRISDGEVWIEPTRDRRYICHNISQDVTKVVVPKGEFIEVICDDGRKSYRDAFSFVPRKPEVDQRVKETLEKIEKEEGPQVIKERLSVIVVGFDSTSQLNFIRRMPKTVSYLTSVLGAIPLTGYNKVGENTLPNVVPLLTGLALEEFKDACVVKHPQSELSVHLDECPFIWKNFSNRGYYTSFAEDDISTGIFNKEWPYAFQKQPTDYYFRTFSYRMFHTQNAYDGMCQGSRMSFEVLFDNIEKTAETFKNDSYFQFTWGTKLAHDDFNRLGWSDLHFHRTLKFLYQNGHLEKTAVLLLGDHGSRKLEIRQTRQGQFEDRLPLAYIVLPPWFKDKYPRAVGNLFKNAQILTSAFDVHETLKDFMDLEALNDMHLHYRRQSQLKVAEMKGARKGTSLFTALPDHRGCLSAGVPPHWCICYKKTPVPVKSTEVHEATNFILRSLNNLIRPYQKKCAKLNLHSIQSALKWNPEEAIQDTYSGNAEENFKRSSLLQIQFVALPGPALFEVTVLNEPDNGWRFTEQVVRLDPYEAHSECMLRHEMKKLCYCTKPKENVVPLKVQEDIIF